MRAARQLAFVYDLTQERKRAPTRMHLPEANTHSPTLSSTCASPASSSSVPAYLE